MNKKYWLKVRTRRYITGYSHNGDTNMPDSIGRKMVELIQDYNEEELNKNPKKRNLATKVIIESYSEDILKYIF